MTFIQLLHNILFTETSFLAGYLLAMLYFSLNFEHIKGDKDGIFLLWLLVIEYLGMFALCSYWYLDFTKVGLLSSMAIAGVAGFLSVYCLFKVRFGEFKYK